MFMPVPNQGEVEGFRALYAEHKGTELTFDHAQEMLTALMQFYYLTGGHEVYEDWQERLRHDPHARNPFRYDPDRVEAYRARRNGTLPLRPEV